MDAWTPHASFRLLASVLQNASLDVVKYQKAEGARARATRARATRYSVAVARLARVLATPQLATASARHRALQARCGCSARAEDAAARRKLGPTTPSRRSDFCKLSAQRAREQALRKNGAPPRARRRHNSTTPTSTRRGRGALSESPQGGTSKRRRRAGRRRAAERRPGRRRRALPRFEETISVRDRRHGVL